MTEQLTNQALPAASNRAKRSTAKGPLQLVFDGLSSFGLSCSLILMLALLTYLGTLEQVELGLFEVQKKYFESFWVLHRLGPVVVPLPGANLVLCVLAVNLFLGGMIRIRKNKRTIGILITHIGIAMLLLSGLIKTYFADEGNVGIYAGESRNWYQSFYNWELVVMRELADGRMEEHVVPAKRFSDAKPNDPITLVDPGLPFEIEVTHWMPNAMARAKGPMFEVDVPVVDGLYLSEEELDPQAERNLAGMYVKLVGGELAAPREGLLWGISTTPWPAEVGGDTWYVDLRHERYPLPFTLELEEFRKIDHPGMTMAKSFEADVIVDEDGARRGLTLSMNQPLRAEGLVVYQSGYIQDPRGGFASTLQVVRNPADQFPKYACYVIAIGLLLHFVRKLVRHVRLEVAR